MCILLQSKNQNNFYKKISKFLYCKTSQNLLYAKKEFVSLQGDQGLYWNVQDWSTFSWYFQRLNTQMFAKQGAGPEA